MSAKTKKKFRFNFIDALLIRSSAAAFAVIVFVVKPGTGVSEPSLAEIEYTIEVTPLRDQFKGDQFIKEGDSVIDAINLREMGKVISVEYKAAVDTSQKSDGEVIVSEYPDRTNLHVTIRATADVSQGNYTVDGLLIATGAGYSMRLPNIYLSGECIKIIEVEG